MVQLVEHATLDLMVRSSSPVLGTTLGVQTTLKKKKQRKYK